ncbi:MAG: hypothetical protein C0506_04485 [Anaerolinea sp.]|nr:hypothetical protein [Anaerolinea sp.]
MVRGSPASGGRVTAGPGPSPSSGPLSEPQAEAAKNNANMDTAATITSAGCGRERSGVAMRGIFLGAVVLGLVAGGIVAGARAVSWGGNGGAKVAGAPAEAGSARATVEAFATAWSAENYEALFLLLDPESQRATTLEQFADTYASFASEMTRIDLRVTPGEVRGSQATLSVNLATAYFGQFEYTTVLNLTKTPAAWAVHWDPSAIHPDMSGGQAFKSAVQRPVRGTIFDRNGAPLAVTRDVRFLGLNRSAVGDRIALTNALVAFGFSKEQVDAAFASPAGQSQRVQVGPVPDEKAEAASTQLRGIPGVLLYFESRRVHPLGAAAAHVVGYTRELTAEELARRPGEGLRPGDRVGATGIEASMEAVLAGKVGSELRLVDAGGATVRTILSREYVAAKEVRTTLDARVLQAAAGRLGERAGAAVVIDPRTNFVLAMNSSPSFDPDAFERNDRAALAAITAAAGSPLTNRATAGLYSAGSTFKLITGAAGLVYGGYKPSDLLECGAVWRGVDPPRRNWEGGQGLLTIAQGLMRSCNSVFYEIGLTLYNGTEGALSKMAREFGLGAASGIVGLGEEEGLVPDAAWKRTKTGLPWYPGDEVNLAIGQGDLLITPLQLANAYSTFVSNALRAPVVLAGEEAKVRGTLPLTPEQKAHLLLGLKLVTSATGTASAAFALAGYTDFAGKSGTAEDVGTQQHVLFVAMSPANAPTALVAIVLDEGQSGSIEAGPIARDLVLVANKP